MKRLEMQFEYRHLAAASIVAGIVIPHVIIAAFVAEPFLLVVAAVGLAVAALAIAVERWWGVLPLLAGAAFASVHMSQTAGVPLSHFDSALDFVPAVGAIAGVAAAATFALSDLFLRAARRGASGSPVASRAFVGGFALFLALSATSLGATILAEPASVTARERAGAQVLVYDGIKVRENTLRAHVGEPLRLVVENHDPIVHDFVIDDTDVSIDLRPSDEKLVEVTFDEPGDYAFRCTLPGHDAMKGMITVAAQPAP